MHHHRTSEVMNMERLAKYSLLLYALALLGFGVAVLIK